MVDPVTRELHGHVVATDVFGDAYVIPMGGLLEDVKRQLGAKSVDLPSTIDFAIIAISDQFGVPEVGIGSSPDPSPPTSLSDLPMPPSPNMKRREISRVVFPDACFSQNTEAGSVFSLLASSSYDKPPNPTFADSAYHSLDPSPMTTPPKVMPMPRKHWRRQDSQMAPSPRRRRTQLATNTGERPHTPENPILGSDTDK